MAVMTSTLGKQHDGPALHSTSWERAEHRAKPRAAPSKVVPSPELQQCPFCATAFDTLLILIHDRPSSTRKATRLTHINIYLRDALDCVCLYCETTFIGPSILNPVLSVGEIGACAHEIHPLWSALPPLQNMACKIANVLVPWDEGERRNQSFAQEPKCAGSGCKDDHSSISLAVESGGKWTRSWRIVTGIEERLIKACWERNVDFIVNYYNKTNGFLYMVFAQKMYSNSYAEYPMLLSCGFSL
ncbi:hypothetical protein EV421DRAFT_410109 [Armillaria borealis]|uniref:Uncharacterized protein n=1 Tax=Armillaria borealis TaxID=47425 RepID=A0AA39K4Q8_9AGAR|nr:hypothetical protein EV421DRAFT_410109 [Armillaria borealis]